MQSKKKLSEKSEFDSQFDRFITQNREKKFVVVQGLGFVGAVMSLVVANSVDGKYAVIGIDLPSRIDVVNDLNNGVFPIKSSDQKVLEYFQSARQKNTFFATTDTNAYSLADVIIVDVNLDVQKNISLTGELETYDIDLKSFSLAIRTIALNCKPNVLILIETTVPPGTCINIVKPIMQEVFKERGLALGYKIGHSYERVMPGPGYVDSIKNFYRVYSGIDELSANETRDFLESIISTIEYPLTRLGNTTASEMSKVLENSFRAMNIAFIQEWTEFAENAGVNLYEVIDAIRMRPTHKNIMYPGLGVGGYCLTKDPLLASWSSQKWFHSCKLVQSEAAVKINDKMPLHTFKTVYNYFEKNLRDKRILIVGVSYLKNVGDTRYTPVALLYDKLLEYQAILSVHDPYIVYWEEKSVNIQQNQELFEKQYDAIIIGTPHDVYISGKVLYNFLSSSNPVIVFDPHGELPNHFRNDFNNKHTFKTIGRGDD